MLRSLIVNQNHIDDRVEETASSQFQARVWTFAKGGDEFTVEQWVDRDTVVVSLTREDETGAETVRSYEFADESAADQFQERLETTLVEFGWSFVGHLPERRSHDDRRQRLRNSDRRRWWTDGALILD